MEVLRSCHRLLPFIVSFLLGLLWGPGGLALGLRPTRGGPSLWHGAGDWAWSWKQLAALEVDARKAAVLRSRAGAQTGAGPRGDCWLCGQVELAWEAGRH